MRSLSNTLRVTAAIGACAWGTPAFAERVTNPIAVFNGLDKITGITTRFEVKVKEEGRFGGLLIKPQVCYTRPITEEPKTTSFVQIEDGKATRLFSGWMFAESPGLNALEHPIIDVWLIGCLDPNAPPPPIETGIRKTEDGEEQSSSESGDTGEEADESGANGDESAKPTDPDQPAQGEGAAATPDTPPTGLATPETKPEEDSEEPAAED
jgi:hypothetical protein